MTLFIDVDGVLRDLSFAAFERPACTWQDTDYNGNTLVDIVNKNLNLCLNANPTPYLKVIKDFHKYKGIEMLILTSQPKTWRVNTELWLSLYLEDYSIIYAKTSNEKLGHLKQGDYLIDDSPMFWKFDQIIMPDYIYNRGVNPLYRVMNSEELEVILRGLDI